MAHSYSFYFPLFCFKIRLLLNYSYHQYQLKITYRNFQNKKAKDINFLLNILFLMKTERNANGKGYQNKVIERTKEKAFPFVSVTHIDLLTSLNQ